MRQSFAALMMICWAQAPNAEGQPPAITDDAFSPINIAEAELGQLLFYDPILSGNRNVACATCHHPDFGTSDGVSLSLGDGGIGLGSARRGDPENMPERRIPRNSPGLFNLGAREFTALFHDGRISVDPARPGGLRTPLDADMVSGFASLLSAQTMFPVLSADEMAGHYSENDVSRAVRQGLLTGPGGAWDLIARRVADVPEYSDAFIAAYPHINTTDDIAFTDISNAIAIFIAFEWRSDTAPFDAVLRGERTLPEPAQTGMALFYGDAGCSRCHTGPFLTDHDYHVMAAPQIGPGKAASFENHMRDDGRFGVTGDAADRFAFRTPSLRNVALTAPYGHAGAHRDLDAFVAAHANPAAGLRDYNRAQAVLPDFSSVDFAVLDDPAQMDAIADAVDGVAVTLSEDDIAALVAFLDALTDPVAVIGRMGIPESVPSGLPVPR